MDKTTNDIEKLEKQINLLKERETSKKNNHVIYIDRLEDDHIQKNKNKKDSDTKKIAKIDELNEDNELEQEKTIKLERLDTEKIEENITKKEEIKKEKKEENHKIIDAEEKVNYSHYYWIMLIIIIVIIVFFAFLIFL